MFSETLDCPARAELNQSLDDTTARTAPVLSDYKRYVIGMSGGKDSVACLLHLLEMGVDPGLIELHHHLVDGRESTLMDWPCTDAYCEALAAAFGIKYSRSWRVGGIEREALRDNQPTAPVAIPDGDGYRLIGGKGPNGTRQKFPQVCASLAQRWCSAYAKIMPFDAWVNNDPKFLDGKTLVLTGERAQESKARSNYRTFEPHRADNRHGRKPRHVDHWRPVHAWTSEQVWSAIERWRLQSHPAYELNFGRTSCRVCIFGSKNQWATVRVIAPTQFQSISDYEKRFDVTIHRSECVTTRANAGIPYPVDPFWVEVANKTTFDLPIFVQDWRLPPGAFGESCGPT